MRCVSEVKEDVFETRESVFKPGTACAPAAIEPDGPSWPDSCLADERLVAKCVAIGATVGHMSRDVSVRELRNSTAEIRGAEIDDA